MHDSKVCFKCEQVKPLSDFYKHSRMADGRLNKCKECSKKDTKENRLKNIDYYLEYDKSRANNPDRVQTRKNYAETQRGIAAGNKAKKEYLERNKIKHAVHIIFRNAVRDGKIIKKDICESCGIKHKRIHGHHDDYAYPLSVRWLCPKCHSAWHKENESING